jgi:hypothetical protein
MRSWFWEKTCDLFAFLDWGNAYQWAGKKMFDACDKEDDKLRAAIRAGVKEGLEPLRRLVGLEEDCNVSAGSSGKKYTREMAEAMRLQRLIAMDKEKPE